MFCTKCGTQLPEGVKFCTKCGAQVSQGPKAKVSAGPEEKSGPAGQEAQSAVSATSKEQSLPEKGELQPGEAAAPEKHKIQKMATLHGTAQPGTAKQRGRRWYALVVAGGILACAALALWAVFTKLASPVTASSASGQAVSQTEESISKPGSAPPADAFTDVEALGDFSEGLAFARVTRPDGTQEYAYITSGGEIAFTLPEGYNFGFAFHEGYAPIAQLPGVDDLHIGTDEFFSERALSGENCLYNLVDAKGNIMYSDGPYYFIGEMGEGKVLTWSITEDHTGTTQTLAYRDAEENILWQADADALYEDAISSIPQNLRRPWAARYRDGIAFLYEENGGFEYVYGYDGEGALLQTFHGERSGDFSSPYSDCFIAYQDTGIKFLAGIYQRSANTYTPLETMDDSLFHETHSILPDGYPVEALGKYFNNGYTIAPKESFWEDGFFILDSAGNIVADRVQDGLSDIGYGLGGYWVAELQNGYYSLLDTNGELTCEPVQSKPVHLGDGLFAWDDGRVTDASGTEQFQMPAGHEPLNCAFATGEDYFYPSDGLFHEGIAVVTQGNSSSRRPAHFMGRDGQLLQSSTDFRTYADETDVDGAGAQSTSAPSAGAEETSPLAGVEPKEFVERYSLTPGAGNLHMREAPNTNAEIVDLLFEGKDFFYPLKEENGWYYGVYLGQAGWCSAEYLVPDSSSGNTEHILLPEFLSAEQQLAYLRAYTLFTSTYWATALRDFSGGVKSETIINGQAYVPCSAFLGQYARYKACVDSLFSGSAAQAHFFSRGNFASTPDGKLYETAGDGGSILGVDLQSYSFQLDSQTDIQVNFTMTAHYHGMGHGEGNYEADYSREWQISMVKGDDGQWRFTQFAAPGFGPIQ